MWSPGGQRERDSPRTHSSQHRAHLTPLTCLGQTDPTTDTLSSQGHQVKPSQHLLSANRHQCATDLPSSEREGEEAPPIHSSVHSARLGEERTRGGIQGRWQPLSGEVYRSSRCCVWPSPESDPRHHSWPGQWYASSSCDRNTQTVSPSLHTYSGKRSCLSPMLEDFEPYRATKCRKKHESAGVCSKTFPLDGDHRCSRSIQDTASLLSSHLTFSIDTPGRQPLYTGQPARSGLCHHDSGKSARSCLCDNDNRSQRSGPCNHDDWRSPKSGWCGRDKTQAAWKALWVSEDFQPSPLRRITPREVPMPTPSKWDVFLPRSPPRQAVTQSHVPHTPLWRSDARSVQPAASLSVTAAMEASQVCPLGQEWVSKGWTEDGFTHTLPHTTQVTESSVQASASSLSLLTALGGNPSLEYQNKRQVLSSTSCTSPHSQPVLASPPPPSLSLSVHC